MSPRVRAVRQHFLLSCLDVLSSLRKPISAGIALVLGLMLAASLLPSTAQAQAQDQVFPPCAWPVVTSPAAFNVAYPDSSAIYWSMPFDNKQWSAMVLTGQFPAVRFMSLTSYDESGAALEGLLDYDVRPDQGSRNPFTPGKAAQVPGKGQSYTVTVDQASKAPKGGNHLRLNSDSVNYVIYRLYVPNNGQNQQGGVSLPAITLITRDGRQIPLQTCTNQTFEALASNGFAFAIPALLELINNATSGGGNAGTCPRDPTLPDFVPFAIPQDTSGYFPNPANKYISAPTLCYEANRVLVVRGKAAMFPDTFNGAPVWQPPGQYAKVDMRYWSMCNNDQVVPFPVVQCAPDYATRLDDQGYYTYVMGRDPAPSWLPAQATWLSWGLQDKPNVLLFRNMIPAPSFKQSVQAAIAAGCTFDNKAVPVTYDSLVKAGKCAAGVMGAYYPTAVYCDEAVLQSQGWQGCFAKAGVTPP